MTTDIIERIKELGKLEDGWYNSVGLAPNKSELFRFGQILIDNYPQKFIHPTIFPTIEGNIQLEWSLNDHDISLEVQLKDLTGELTSINTLSYELVKHQIIDLTSTGDWELLTNYLIDI